MQLESFSFAVGGCDFKAGGNCEAINCDVVKSLSCNHDQDLNSIVFDTTGLYCGLIDGVKVGESSDSVASLLNVLPERLSSEGGLELFNLLEARTDARVEGLRPALSHEETVSRLHEFAIECRLMGKLAAQYKLSDMA